MRVRATYASQVMSLKVQHEANDIVPQVFHVTSEKVLFKANLRLVLSNTSLQCREPNFPVLVMDLQQDTSYRVSGYTHKQDADLILPTLNNRIDNKQCYQCSV